MINYGKICGVLCAIALLAMLHADDARADEPNHYRLKRRVVRVELDSNPLVRVQCTLQDSRGVSETMVWDPNERRGLSRYALLPPKQGKADVFSCVSDRLDLPDTGGSFTYVFGLTEDCVSKVATPDPTKVTGCWKPITTVEESKKLSSISLTVTTKAVEDTEEITSVLDQLGGFEQTTNLRSLDPTTMLVNDLLGTLATIALDRASEAGKQYVRSFLQDALCERLTFEKVQDALPAESELRKELERLGWRADRRLLQTTCTLIDTARIDELASARDAVWRAVAVDATVLAGAILEGAIRDLTVPALNGQKYKTLENIVRSLGDLMRSMISGNTATTERDVQVMILALGRVGLDAGLKSANWRCGLEVGIAVLRDCLRDQSCFADELQRLLEQERRLPEVTDKASESNTCNVGEALDAWPELPTLLGRVADVLRPAPGVDASLTAATAFELVLDVAEHVIVDFARSIEIKEAEVLDEGEPKQICVGGKKCAELLESYEALLTEYERTMKDVNAREQYFSLLALKGNKPQGETLKGYAKLVKSYIGQRKSDENLFNFSSRYAYTLAMIRTLRAIVAVVRGEDPAPAIVELAAVLNKAITGHCENKCDVLVTTANLRRAFAVVSALASYGASYRGNDSGDDAPVELQKQRAEERRKALEAVIDAFTDRSQRRNELVLSLGANVSLGVQGSHVGELQEIFNGDKWNRNLLSLPMGLALQRLPGPNCRKLRGVCLSNFHAMLTFIDLAQYLTTSKQDVEVQSPKPELTTALRIGVEGGLLFGEPSFPISLTLHGAWIPRVTYEDSDKPRSELRYGISVGVYVPFLDLN